MRRPRTSCAAWHPVRVAQAPQPRPPRQERFSHQVCPSLSIPADGKRLQHANVRSTHCMPWSLSLEIVPIRVATDMARELGREILRASNDCTAVTPPPAMAAPRAACRSTWMSMKECRVCQSVQSFIERPQRTLNCETSSHHLLLMPLLHTSPCSTYLDTSNAIKHGMDIKA